MILNDVWAKYMQLIQSANDNTDLTKKLSAFNTAQEYLVERMIELTQVPDEFLSDPVNIANTINLNYVAVPTDFLALHKLWRRSGAQYIPFEKEGIITYDELLNRVGQNFFDSTVNAEPQNAAIKEPNCYFDQHFNNTFTDDETITGATSGATATVDSVSGTTLTYSALTGAFQNGEVIEGSTSGTQATVSADSDPTMTVTITGGTKQIKMSYQKLPTEVEAYDKLVITSASGTFTVGETVTGGTSSASATVNAVADDDSYLYLEVLDKVGTWSDGETITGGDSGETATAGAFTQKVQALTWRAKYKFLLAQAASLVYLHMKDNNEVEMKSSIVDNLIEQFSVVNRNNETANWSTYL
jgi:hypothetical protein